MIIPSKRLNSFIWPIDLIVKSTITLGQRESENNGNEAVLLIPQTSRLKNYNQIQLRVKSLDTKWFQALLYNTNNSNYNLILIIHFHTVKYFQEFLSDNRNIFELTKKYE